MGIQTPYDLTPKEMLDDLQKHYGKTMTEWQAIFVDDLQTRIALWPDLPLTEKQIVKIAEIYAEKDIEDY